MDRRPTVCRFGKPRVKKTKRTFAVSKEKKEENFDGFHALEISYLAIIITSVHAVHTCEKWQRTKYEELINCNCFKIISCRCHSVQRVPQTNSKQISNCSARSSHFLPNKLCPYQCYLWLAAHRLKSISPRLTIGQCKYRFHVNHCMRNREHREYRDGENIIEYAINFSRKTIYEYATASWKWTLFHIANKPSNELELYISAVNLWLFFFFFLFFS